jgi:hypothetical protein
VRAETELGITKASRALWRDEALALREDNKRLEALLRAKDEMIGELLELAEYQPEPVVIYRRLGA